MEQLNLHFAPERRIYTVGELTAAIGDLLDREFPDVWVAGEISGARLAGSGHYYFTLKEQDSQVRCVCFRSTVRYLRFKPQDGMAVLARGRIEVYAARGEYQLVVEMLEPQGLGALQIAFEQLKKKLSAEGLFDPSRKRPLPRLPGRIGIVTSPSGAVIRDMLQILERRFPGLHVRIYPAQVQGPGSIEDIVNGLNWFSRSGWPDVVILARGGGSLEDLWTFNEEAVARAIAGCAAPVISAIGHETDFTIADFVADLRAPTPSAAAELVICSRQQLLEQIAAFAGRLDQAMNYRLADCGRRLHQQGIERVTALLHRTVGRFQQRVDELDYRLHNWLRALIDREKRRFQETESRLLRLDLRLRFAGFHRRLEAAEAAASGSFTLRLARKRGRLETLEGQLSQLSPLRILERGYAIVRGERGDLIVEAEAAPAGSFVEVLLARGRLRARVTESTPDGSSEPPS